MKTLDQLKTRAQLGIGQLVSPLFFFFSVSLHLLQGTLRHFTGRMLRRENIQRDATSPRKQKHAGLGVMKIKWESGTEQSQLTSIHDRL